MHCAYDDPYTGLLTQLVRLTPRAHDPAVAITAGEMPPWFPGEQAMGCSGAGWTTDQADQACFGEALERCVARALPCDQSIQAAWSDWPAPEPAIDPASWVLFHDEQYASQGFPFEPLNRETVCRWVCCREAATGAPRWVPEELVFLVHRPGQPPRHTVGLSTGLSCARTADLAVLRGVQEVIERDAVMGGWWGRYPLEEWQPDAVIPTFGESCWNRVSRPSLHYRFYRIRTPFSSHVTLISLSGLDHEGWVFCVGSACRETLDESWLKSLLEVVQGRHCVRRLLARWIESGRPRSDVPTTFFEHALFYSLNRERLLETVLEHATRSGPGSIPYAWEGPKELRRRLGPDRPILFRNLTPSSLAEGFPDQVVFRVLVPGLQQLHGDHRLPFLGGPLWAPRSCADWASIPPHPFA
jgi:ribosomal protein S12 methylthiotransferase accessory factor